MKHTDYLKKKKNREIRRRIISILSAIVVFVATYALVLPALTLDVKTASMEPGMSVQQEADPEAVSAPEASEEEEAVEEEPAEAEEHEKEEESADEKAGEQGPVEEDSNEKADEAAQKTEDEQIESADAAASGKASSSNSDAGDASDQSADQSGTDGSEAAAAEEEDAAADVFNIPELEAVNFDTILTDKTDFYYYHEEISEEEGSEDASKKAAVSSTDVQDWKKVKEDTILAPEDFVRVYLAYTIPAGALNETNTVARYRIPEGLELTDKQIKAINENENGISGTDKDAEDYNKYLGAEAIEGTRTPDKILKEGTEEYISATVKAEKVYDEEKNYLGQDLIFTFVPYTVQKNQIAYDENGKAKSEGKEVRGWFSFDLTPSRITFEETEAAAAESGLVRSEAKITFVKENKKKNIDEISRALTLDAPAATVADETEEKTEQAVEQKTLTYEGADYTVIINYTDDAEIPDNATLEVSEIGKDTPEYNNYLEQAKAAVKEDKEEKTINEARFFDITILADGEKVEPAAPVNVQINFAGIEQTKAEDAQLLHYKDDEVQVMDKAEFSKSEDAENEEKAVDTVQFETDGFSVYGIVGTETLTTQVITSEGETYTIEVTYGPEAEIPDGAKLYATEITDPELYDGYMQRAADAVEQETGENNLLSGRFFDIQIKDGEDIVEPKATVNVTIKYVEEVSLSKEDSMAAIHFAKDGIDLVEVNPEKSDEGGTSISFEQDSFSVTGTIITSGVISNGNYCILYKNGSTNTYYALGNDGSATEVTVEEDGTVKPVSGEDLPNNLIWTRTGQVWRGNRNQGRYLRPDNGSATSTNSENLTIASSDDSDGNDIYKISRSQQYGWSTTTYYLRYNNGFTGGTQDSNNQFYLAKIESDTNYIIHYGYLDNNGNYVEWEDQQETLRNPNMLGDQYDVRKDIEGYEYVTSRLSSSTGTDIINLLQTVAGKGVQLSNNTTAVWNYRVLTSNNTKYTSYDNLGTDFDYLRGTQLNNDIYVVYRKDNKSSSSSDTGLDDIDAPDISKNKVDNGDGTYDIDLSVTGEAAASAKAGRANVVVVLDSSLSMSESVTGGTKWDLTTSAIKQLSTDLLGLNATGDDPERVEFAFVNFSNFVKNESWIYSVGSNNKNQHFYTDAGSFNTMINGLNVFGGTCWDKAMAAAASILWDDDDQVYVIFVSDGNTISRAYSYGNYDYWDGGTYYESNATDYNSNPIVKLNVDSTVYFADKIRASGGTIFTVGIDGGGTIENLYRLNHGSKDNPINHFDVKDADSMEDAFESIKQSILNTLGYQNIQMTDGLTGMTSTALVDGTAGNFSYTVAKYTTTTEKLAALPAGASYGSVKDANGNITTYSRNTGDDQATYPVIKTVKTVVAGTQATVTKNNNGTLSIRFPDNTTDTVSQATYDEDDKRVNWQFGDTYQLRDGYTYTVSFTVWPNQASYDIIAALRNGLLSWEDEEAFTYTDEDGQTKTIPFSEYSAQIEKSGDSYSLKSNVETGNTVSYYKVSTETLKNLPDGASIGTTTDPVTGVITSYTSNGDGTYTKTVKTPGSLDFINPEPMPLTGTRLEMTKNWNDDLDPQNLKDLIEKAGFNEDGTSKYGVTLHVSQGEEEYKSFVFHPVKNTAGDYVWPSQTINISPALLVSELPVGSEASNYKTVTIGGTTYYVLNEGHIYTIDEEDNGDFHFEFEADPYHPALLDNVLNNVEFRMENGQIVGGSEASVVGDVPLEEFNAYNNMTSELDITKIISDPNDLMSEAEEKTETFTYRVTLKIPETGDPCGITGYEFVPRTQANAFPVHGYQTTDTANNQAISNDVDRFKEEVVKFRAWNTLAWRSLVELNPDNTVKRDAEGKFSWKSGLESETIDDVKYYIYTIDMTLKQDEVLRFTNLPKNTKYIIEELYVNKYPADNVGGKTDGRTPVTDPENVTARYNETTYKTKVDGTETEPASGRRVEGTISIPDARYYNQFTNKVTASSNDVRAEIKVKKVVDGYDWGEEFYRFTLTPGTAAYSDGETGTSPMPDGTTNSQVDIYSTTEDHTLSFGNILYTRAGTYTYTIKEGNNTANLPYINFAGDVELTVTVTADSSGKLTVSNISDNMNPTQTEFEAATANNIAYSLTTMTNTTVPINLKKVDEKSGNVAEGAVFELHKDGTKLYFDSDYKILTVNQVLDLISTEEHPITDISTDEAKEAMEEKGITSSFEMGEVSLKGYQMTGYTYNSDSGEFSENEPIVYELVEISPPPGYILTENEKINYFKVIGVRNETELTRVRYTGVAIRLTDQNGNTLVDDETGEILLEHNNAKIDSDQLMSMSLSNKSGAELPYTGGPGTLTYTLSGIALIMASALMYGFRMRRRERRLK